MAWCNSGSRNMNSYARRGYDRIGSFKALVSHESKSPRWRLLWRKIVKEKRKIFDCSSSAQANITYDPYTYSQNFDHGLIISNPDDSSRSFSARFAVPSRIFEKGGMENIEAFPIVTLPREKSSVLPSVSESIHPRVIPVEAYT